jgi:signal transduction histidine kinase
MQLKTSTKISLKFTFFASVILFIFSFVIFVLFFRTRYSKQKARLYVNAEYEPPFLLEFVQRAPGGSIAYQNVPLSASDAAPGSVPPIRVSFTQVATPANRKHFLDHKLQKIFGSQRRIVSDAQEILLEDFSLENGYYPREGLSRFSRGAISIFFKDGEYFVYTIEHNIVKFLNITGFVYSQLELIQILLFWDCCFLIVVYVISLYFVKSSLKNLKKMARFAQELDFNTLSSFLDIKGHKYDEIKVIADAFNASLQKINVQIISLKDFIANASHELKTPLMMINSEIDIALKKKDYEERLLNIKQSVKRLSDLLEHLSLITRLESAPVIQKESLLLESFVDEVVAPLSKKYPTVHISLQIPH